MFKLGQCAEKKWRRLRGFDYLTKVITGVKFKDGVEVTEIDLVAALFRSQNTTFGNNSPAYRITAIPAYQITEFHG